MKNEMTASTKALSAKIKSAPVSMKHYNETDKSGNLVLHSLKIYANSKREDTAIITRAEQAKLKKAKTLQEFRSLLREKCNANALRVDSASTKANLSNHDRTRIACFNVVARALNLTKFVVEYSKKAKAQAKKK